jgi:hypothetical protein
VPGTAVVRADDAGARKNPYWAELFRACVLSSAASCCKFELAELLQIRVGHQAVGVFVPAIDGFAQILQRVIGVVGSQLSRQNTLSLTN